MLPDTLVVNSLKGHPVLSTCYGLLSFLVLAAAVVLSISDLTQLSFSLLAFSLLTVLCYIVQLFSKKLARDTSFLFVLSMFSVLTTLRLATYFAITQLIVLVVLTLVAKLVMLFDIACADIREYTSAAQRYIKCLEWHVLWVRMCVAFVFIPHFCEKLFAGAAVRQLDVDAFAQLGLPYPLVFVLVAGLCEFSAALALGVGFLTRLTAVCTVLYLLVSTYLGGHFSSGFIWVSAGGGWEYPVLWVLIVSAFAIFGPGYFSVDQLLSLRVSLPKWVRWFMGV